MDGTALSDSIFQFVGSGAPAQSPPDISVPATEGTAEEAPRDVIEVKEGSNSARGTDFTGSTTGQVLQEQMRTLVGSKLGDFNMRGVEAGMGMVNVNARNTGKLLNTQRRRQQRADRSSPYGGRSSSREDKHKSTGTDEGSKVSSCQAASTVRASGRGGGDGSSSGLEGVKRTPVGHEK